MIIKYGMKMNNKIVITKTTSILLSVVLFIGAPLSVNAESLNDMVLSTSTSAGTWTDPLGGSTYMYGGDYKIKLKTSSTVPPLVQFQLPSVSKGCSGISISGGFLSYLGLDKLQSILSNAGSSLVFGVVLGIEFTLPAIGAVFDKVRAWANALQALLQNGCGIGKAFARGSGMATMFQSKKLNDNIKGTFDGLDNFVSGGDTVLEEIQKLANCTGNLNDPNCKNFEDAVSSFSFAIAETLSIPTNATPSANVSGGNVKNATQHDTSSKGVATTFLLSSFYTNKKISCPNTTSNTISDIDLTIDKIKFIFFGDIGTDNTFMTETSKVIDQTNCILSANALSSDLSNTITTGNKSSFPKPSYAVISPLIEAKDAAHSLIYGFDKLSDSYSNISGNTITIPDRQITYFDLPYDFDKTTHEAKKRVITTYLNATPSQSASNINITWNGALNDSLTSIYKLIDAQTSNTWRGGSSYSQYDTNTTTIQTPLLLPGIKKYVNIISKVEKRNKAETEQTAQLKVILAKINAIRFSEALINTIESKTVKMINGMKGNSLVLNGYLKTVRDIKKEIEKELYALRKDVAKSDLETIFKSMEKDQVINSLKIGR